MVTSRSRQSLRSQGVYHCQPATPTYGNSPPLCTTKWWIPSLTPLDLRKAQLEQNGYASHQEWLSDWQDARRGEIFVLGSRDETAGCQLCVATVSDDGTLTLRLRMPDCLAGQHGKYLTIAGVHFNHGHEQVLVALDSNADYSRYRREHGERVAREPAWVKPSATGSSGTGKAGGCSPAPT